MHIDNFRKNDAVNMKPPKGSVPDDEREKFNFIRKGKVGDGLDHFTCEDTLNEFNNWIEKSSEGIDIEIIKRIRNTT